MNNSEAPHATYFVYRTSQGRMTLACDGSHITRLIFGDVATPFGQSQLIGVCHSLADTALNHHRDSAALGRASASTTDGDIRAGIGGADRRVQTARDSRFRSTPDAQRILRRALDSLGEKQACALTNRAFEEILEYLSGKRCMFDVPLAPQGSMFQLSVWRAVQSSPFGTTVTYDELARKITSPKARSAVAAACAANPIPLLIPTHRVIGRKGDIGSFAASPEIKKFLLNLEARTA